MKCYVTFWIVYIVSCMIRMFWVLQIAPLHHVQWQLLISTVSRERASRQHGLSTGYTITIIRDPDGDYRYT